MRCGPVLSILAARLAAAARGYERAAAVAGPAAPVLTALRDGCRRDLAELREAAAAAGLALDEARIAATPLAPAPTLDRLLARERAILILYREAHAACGARGALAGLLRQHLAARRSRIHALAHLAAAACAA